MSRNRFILGGLVPALIIVGCSGDESPTVPDSTPSVISVDDVTLVEGNTALFGVSLDKASDGDVTFGFSTVDGTAVAGSDYNEASGNQTISSGVTNVTVLVATIDDTEIESDETFSLTLTSVTGATVGKSLATATITDNDPTQVSFASDVQPLLRTSCAKLGTCHGGAFAGGSFFIDISATYTNVINATGDNTQLLAGSPDGKVVQPGNSANSTLYTKTTDSPPFPNQMPPVGALLSLSQQRLIRDWIDQGAQDN